MWLKAEHQKRPVVAVGVLGSDVYDKLIVLQALRPELPQAVFFTTDLDALYLHADNTDVTRNLLVASANDLDPDIGGGDDLWSVPPMRNSYQTILFEATRRLVRGEKLQAGTKVQLFEIGAGRAVSLDSFPKSAESSMIVLFANPFWNFLVFTLALANGILVLAAVSSRHESSYDAGQRAPLMPWARRLLFVECSLAALAIVALAYLFFLNWIRGEKTTAILMEPLSWTSGVSVWPTILIRCVAFLVALLLMIKASEAVDVKYRLARERLQDLPGTGARLPWSLSLWEWVSDLWRRRRGMTPPRRTFKQLLDKIHACRRRVGQITVFAVIYLAFSIFLFAMVPTYTPGRGFAVLLVEKIGLALGIGLYIVHLLYCLDLHLGAQTLLQALREQLAENESLDEYRVLETAGEYTVAVGRTLLYPLTVLIILMLSRIRLFDAWSMTPSLWITLCVGAVLLTAASLAIVSEAGRMRKEALDRTHEKKYVLESKRAENVQSQIVALENSIEQLRKLETGAFSTWYQQPIFAALVSMLGVFGSISFAKPIVELLGR